MYNDFQLTDNLSAKAMRQKFQAIQGLEAQDIGEIAEKLHEQREYLASKNEGQKYDKIITKIDESLIELDGILRHSNIEKTNLKATNLMNFLTHRGGPSRALESTENDTQTKPNGDGSNIINNDENSDISGGLEEPNSDNNEGTEDPGNTNNGLEGEVPQQDGDKYTNTNNANPQNTYKRNFPMPGSILYRLTQSLFVKRHSQQVKSNMRPNMPPWNPPHFPPFENEMCDPREKCVTNQLDILRMMLLFMTLRPNCRYMPRICRIASTQLDILSEMVR